MATTKKNTEDLYVDVEYDGPIDDTGKRHIGPFIASGANGVKVLFMPGANRIPAEQWLAICEAQGVKWRLEEGHFRILFNGIEEAGGGHDISKEPQRRALELIHDTIEPEILEAWLAQEKAGKARKSVVKALEEQLTHVEPDPAKRGKPELRPHRMPEGMESVTE